MCVKASQYFPPMKTPDLCSSPTITRCWDLSKIWKQNQSLPVISKDGSWVTCIRVTPRTCWSIDYLDTPPHNCLWVETVHLPIIFNLCKYKPLIMSPQTFMNILIKSITNSVKIRNTYLQVEPTFSLIISPPFNGCHVLNTLLSFSDPLSGNFFYQVLQ